MLVQVYVDDIIFGSTKKSWCDEFEALMKSRFQMSSIGELTFFLGLQVKQNKEGIFISQDKYWNGYLRKGRKTKPKRQNQTRNGKAGKRQSQSPSPSVEKSTQVNPKAKSQEKQV
ncbi:uncharacterized mitochondrial protein-like protein [Tanacetum coccineum]